MKTPIKKRLLNKILKKLKLQFKPNLKNLFLEPFSQERTRINSLEKEFMIIKMLKSQSKDRSLETLSMVKGILETKKWRKERSKKLKIMLNMMVNGLFQRMLDMEKVN